MLLRTITINDIQSSCFDYIIIGGGTSGCVLGARLASIPHVSVLLVEAGRDSGLAPDVLVPGKYVFQLDADKDGLWELPTVPQRHLNGRVITFLRGKQMGGTSAINYMALARGPAADYDAWADMVGDDAWRWENILPLMKDLEDFNPQLPSGFEGYASPRPEHHGKGGPLKVGFGQVMVPGVETFFKACLDAGIPVCLDNNSGDPVGVGLAQFNVRHGERSYAANAFLPNARRMDLTNLTVVTNTECDRVVIKEGKAVGVDLFDKVSSKTAYIACNKEVIVCAGTLATPKVLMLSGIGPKRLLEKQCIPVQVDSPGCGQNMLDHTILTTEYEVDDRIPAHNQIFLDHDLLTAAEAEYAQSRTGPLAMYGSSGSVAFPKIPAMYNSKEFHDLDPSTKDFLLEASRPSAEIWLGSGPAAYSGPVGPKDSYITHEMLLQNNLSRGSVVIASKNPRDLPVIDPNFLSHPFDKRIAIETVRMALKIAQAAAYRGIIRRMVHGPNIDVFSAPALAISDDILLEFIKENLGQGYHSVGTCKMGRPGEPAAVVDARFKVIGVENLRVADLSVCPILTSNHTQINAYLIGEVCARQIIQEEGARRLAKL
ncbi:glucose-methanol-choline oxidoreductase [Aspergillus granulosus]|uniref:Glucose-methanol-choline oxidoreductase n=1 Tax=Aspergillus granulosus TaxID=176169 RepID=A0ABR4HYF1_9EURO